MQMIGRMNVSLRRESTFAHSLGVVIKTYDGVDDEKLCLVAAVGCEVFRPNQKGDGV